MNKLSSTFVCKTTSILEAIEKLDKNALRILLVVDKDHRLLGTLTDGDIRRFILKGQGLDKPIARAMNTKPLVTRYGASFADLHEEMIEKDIFRVPVLDAKGRVIGLEGRDSHLGAAEDSWVVLMAGGEGKRLRPITESIPKPLVEVDGTPIIEHILCNLKEYGFRKFYVSVNYKAEMVKKFLGNGKKWGVEIRYLHEKKVLGTAGALSLLPGKPEQPILVINGDILTSVNYGQLLDYHRQEGAEATMCIRQYSMQVPYGVVKVKDHSVKGIKEKPVHSFFVNAGIYMINPSALAQMKKNQFINMTTLFETLIQKKKTVRAFPILEYWLDIGRPAELAIAGKDMGAGVVTPRRKKA